MWLISLSNWHPMWLISLSNWHPMWLISLSNWHPMWLISLSNWHPLWFVSLSKWHPMWFISLSNWHPMWLISLSNWHPMWLISLSNWHPMWLISLSNRISSVLSVTRKFLPNFLWLKNSDMLWWLWYILKKHMFFSILTFCDMQRAFSQKRVETLLTFFTKSQGRGTFWREPDPGWTLPGPQGGASEEFPFFEGRCFKLRLLEP